MKCVKLIIVILFSIATIHAKSPSKDDQLLASYISSFNILYNSYFIESGKLTCLADSMGFKTLYSQPDFPVNFICDEKSGLASFSVIGELGTCGGSTIDVKPTVISQDSLQLELKFDSKKCDKVLRKLIDRNMRSQ